MYCYYRFQYEERLIYLESREKRDSFPPMIYWQYYHRMNNNERSGNSKTAENRNKRTNSNFASDKLCIYECVQVERLISWKSRGGGRFIDIPRPIFPIKGMV